MESIMNEKIKYKALNLEEDIRSFLKSKYSLRICDRAKDILIKYQRLIITLSYWSEDDEDSWFKLWDESYSYVEDFYFEGGFLVEPQFEKRCAKLLLKMSDIVEDSWLFKFKREEYLNLQNTLTNPSLPQSFML